jgi:hypothetical protein
MSNCIKCGAFAGAESWKTLCLKHYREQKRKDEDVHERLAQLMQENQYLRMEIRAAQTPTFISDKRVRQLLQLCHPDKHNNSETSNDVTRWLLSLRGK